ncbi:AAA family ATPase [Tropicibacter sp. R16_0]|uniref:AAA family ATPase n=1 Tax=Tropicibacter sp. R16_0 TaxID=2821102 RepID=UPI001ADA8593|nr:AAA family ATPase [Tropicibacter sp. R16_0]MBO9450239.1 AAA family ATPase [Tropicibacter sp. R16_0]
MPVLMSFTGLPGVGKSTIAKEVAENTGALWLWIDQIEVAMKASHMVTDDLADGGYAAAQAVAKGALRQGVDVIADCVNPITLTRAAWRAVADDTGARLITVELTCSDQDAHRRRIETRQVDLPGWVGPDWQAVQDRTYEPMPDADVILDTGQTSVEAAVERLSRALEAAKQET